MFGGFRGTGYAPGDTWSWNGTTWTQLSPATSPPARAYGSMTYDGANQRVVLYAGRTNLPTTYPTTAWSWDGSTWASP